MTSRRPVRLRRTQLVKVLPVFRTTYVSPSGICSVHSNLQVLDDSVMSARGDLLGLPATETWQLGLDE